MRVLPARTIGVAIAALAVIGAVVLPVTGRQPTGVARAADTSQFKAGDIITDQLFFDGTAMSAATVQNFLNVRNANCADGAMPCLKRYRQTTATRAADANCRGTYVGATSETSATIIAKVGQACGISQRVLLVILQKEEGLVTATGASLTATRYRSAMGFGCPDTAACDTKYYGFFNQVYSAAAQYKRYAANPTNYSHRAGMTNYVRYSPSSSCGSSPVYIANQATAGLYNYTPYQPNAAALAAGAGTGDGCSAYGNRNFWIYFTNWFGSTQTVGAGALVDRYMATGGSGGPLGSVTNGVSCGLKGGGCWQGYRNGAIYWSAATGARVVYSGAVRDKWASLSWERGWLGYPISDAVRTSTGGWFEHFQHGSIYWSTATTAHTISGAVRDRWAASGWERGALGYPAADQGTTPDGTAQFAHFQNGSIYWSPATGAHVVSGAVRTEWASLGWERSTLGLPVADVGATPDGLARFAHFQHGSIYVVSGTSRVLSSPVVAAWQRTGWERGSLGYPTADAVTTAGAAGQVTEFQHGAVYVGPDGLGHALGTVVDDAFGAAGGSSGNLGLPTSDSATTSDGRAVFAHFQGGSIYVVDGARRVLPTAVDAAWAAKGGSTGALGYPAADVVSSGGGLVAAFAGGTVYVKGTAPGKVLQGPILQRFGQASGVTGALGFPLTDVLSAPDGRGKYTHFEHGSIYWTLATGADVVSGPVRDLWAATGWEHGLGYPTTSVTTTPDGVGRFAHFQKGSIYWTEATRAHVIREPFTSAWAATGWERGRLGYPTRDAYAVTGGTRMDFQHGWITVSTATGKATVTIR